MSRAQLETLTVPQLKTHLKARNLKVGGRKAELITRLLTPAPVPVYTAPAVQPVTAYPQPTIVQFTGGLPPITFVQPAKPPRAPRSPRKSPAKKRPRKAKKSPKKKAVKSPKKIARGRSFRADVDVLTVPVLKAILKAKKQKVGGKKADLVARVVILARGLDRAGALKMLSLPALKSVLKARHQKVGGKKIELIARIISGEGIGTQKPRAKSPRAKAAAKAKSPRAKAAPKKK